MSRAFHKLGLILRKHLPSHPLILIQICPSTAHLRWTRTFVSATSSITRISEETTFVAQKAKSSKKLIEVGRKELIFHGALNRQLIEVVGSMRQSGTVRRKILKLTGKSHKHLLLRNAGKMNGGCGIKSWMAFDRYAENSL